MYEYTDTEPIWVTAMQQTELSNLVQTNPHLWRGDRNLLGRPVVSSGFAPLDQALPAGGWPAGVVWLDYPRAGIGELSLLHPAMQQLSRERREVVLLNPPYQPYPAAMPGMATSGLVIEPDRFDNVLWAADKLIRHAACGMVLLWTGLQDPISSAALRRLNLAARHNGTTLFVYNRLCYPAPASMWVAAHCRIQVSDNATEQVLEIHINKAHGLLRPTRCRVALVN